MQVYSIGAFCFGIISGLAGVMPLGVNLLALVKQKKLTSYEDIKSVSTSFLVMLYGVYWISKAFDPPHQHSQRTSAIDYILLLIFVVTLVVLYFVKRRLPKKPTV